MKDRSYLRTIVENYAPADRREHVDRERFLACIDAFDTVLTRENDLCHFTASAWVISARSPKALMVFHRIYDDWSWIGGHADGEGDLLAVARRELAEETGVTTATLLQEAPLSLECLAVQPHERRGVFVPAHLHLNVTYGFVCDEDVPLTVNAAENTAVAWRSFEEIATATAEAHMLPIYRKLMARTARN